MVTELTSFIVIIEDDPEPIVDELVESMAIVEEVEPSPITVSWIEELLAKFCDTEAENNLSIVDEVFSILR